MSRAFHLAKACSADSKKDKTIPADFSSQESNLFYQTILFLEHGKCALGQLSDLEEIGIRLDQGGILNPPMLESIAFNNTLKRHMKTLNEQNTKTEARLMITPGIDNISSSNICIDDVASLKACTISDLLKTSKGKPAVGFVLSVESINQCYLVSGLHFCVKDTIGNVILLMLYNFVPFDISFEQLQVEFPIGSRFRIKNPYVKVSNNGSIALRVDNPCNIIIQLPLNYVPAVKLEVENDPKILKSSGNDFFGKKNYHEAIEQYSNGLDVLNHMKVDLLANRAAAHLQLYNFKNALQDCESVLVINPKHAKTLHRKQLAEEGITKTSRQKVGVYDFTAIPYDPSMQEDCIENFCGPAEIKWLGKKGRGLILTKDVKPGELLLAEKAIAFYQEECLNEGSKIMYSPACMNFDSRKGTKPSTYKLISELVLKASKDPQVNSKLSILAHDINKPNDIIPSMDNWFQSNNFPNFSPISALRISDTVSCNCFCFGLPKEPSKSIREEMTRTIGTNVVSSDFIESFVRRQDKRDTSKYEGTALWILSSFMNHAEFPNTLSEHYGKVKFVFANDFLKAGQELTISYGNMDREAMKKTWGI